MTLKFATTGFISAAACLLLASSWAATAARADALETIPLSYRTAEELIPLLLPLLPAGAVVTGTGDVLLVRADEATLASLRAAVGRFDRAPRQLLITVGHATGSLDRNASVRGSATIGSGDVSVGVNEPPRPGSTGAQVTVRGSEARSEMHNVSSVRTLEGHEAYIAVGESRPYTSSTVTYGAYPGREVVRSTGYREAQTGFYAVPRINGDRVTLEIAPTQQRYTGANRDAAIATQSITTQVSGRLGEWIEIGGVRQAGAGTDTGLIVWGTRSESTQYSAWVKVEEIP